MGRITLFTADGSSDCVRVKKALQKLGLPFVEINVTHHPLKLFDMKVLTNRWSTPQLFFNTRYIGTVEEAMQLLHEWEHDHRRFTLPYDRYVAEIESFPDPMNPRLSVPTTQTDKSLSPVDNDLDILTLMEQDTLLDQVPYPNDTTVPYIQLMEELQRILPRGNNIYRLQTYSSCFTTQQAVKAFTVEYDVKKSLAMEWGRTWQDANVLDHVSSKHLFYEHDTYLFRLQCDHHPEILNDYRQWPRTVKKEPMEVVERLHRLLQRLLNRVMNDQGLMDYEEAARTREYHLLRYFLCELQRVDLAHMDDSVKIAFGINVCNIMLRFAYIHRGFCNTDASCMEYMSLIKFNVGGHVYSFTEWRDGFLRGNRKMQCGSIPFAADDPRARTVVRRPDNRMHFALEWGMPSHSPVCYYSDEYLHEELEMATSAFCERHVSIDSKKGEVKVSKVFQWYKCDFVEDHDDLSEFLLPHLRSIQQQALEKLVHKNVKFSYADYEWNPQASQIYHFHPSVLRTVKAKVREGIKQGLLRTFSTTGGFLHVKVP
jgi:glutaredoxin